MEMTAEQQNTNRVSILPLTRAKKMTVMVNIQIWEQKANFDETNLLKFTA